MFSPTIPGISESDMTDLGVQGCSDNPKYSDDWKWENYLAAFIFGIIGVLVFIGTIVELVTRNPPEKKEKNVACLLLQLIKSFSLVSNIEFIFSISPNSGSDKIKCLDGIRALSMTWVILGHNFYFA